MHHRFPNLVSLPAVAIAAIVAAACPARRQGPELPGLEEQTTEIARQTTRTQRIREVMTRDLERIRTLAEKLRNPPSDLFTGEFPLDLFKHVVVECLNAPAESADAASSPSGSADGKGLELSCSARFVDRLERSLQSHPSEDRRRAYDLLGRIDTFHTLRVRLRRRLSKIDDILQHNRQRLAEERADLRKRRSRWRTRRSEFSAGRWQQLQDRFDALERDLDELERAANRLENAAQKWPATIDRANYRVYFAITSRWDPAD